jgi:hypothetical protein
VQGIPDGDFDAVTVVSVADAEVKDIAAKKRL